MSTSQPAANESRQGVRANLRRVVAASMAGTVVEWYEFFLYAAAATLVFGKQFFPSTGSDLDGIIKAFVTYAVGFAARPLGGIVFGHFGDRYGRKHLLQVSIIMVGAATFLMGCLPTFHQAGYLAPILLIVLRFLQGFAVGGEWGGAVLLVAEHAPDKERGFWASWPQAAVPMGNLLATGVLLVLSSTLSQAAFLSWGWHQVTSLFAGSLAPIIATTLLAKFNSSVPVAIYLAICSVITLVAVIAARETKGTSLHELDRLDAEGRAPKQSAADENLTR